jgi:hypothetical protein
MPIKTFRGQLADEEQDTIRLSTNTGLTGYRIRKFQLMPANPGGQDSVNVCKIFTYEQGTPVATVDFADETMLAAGVCQNTASYAYAEYTTIVFEERVFNQDIYISQKDYATGEAVNYYLELEQIKISTDEAAVATLQDMRGST